MRFTVFRAERGRYLPKNCAAFGEGLIESELFGHERGAFTSAVDRRPGIFEQANGGTVFSRRNNETKLELHAKLLRVLEERQVTRLGGHTPIPVDVRVIAASNRPMQEALAVGRLRPRSLLPTQGIPDPDSSAARAARGFGTAGRAPHRGDQPRTKQRRGRPR
jgi:transcriptional regulator of acetoin/glycerol metabolism